MDLDMGGIVILVGAYGSGKTEVAVNLAAHMRSKGRRVRIADLDLVNPYFRTRQARHALGRLGIDVVLPPTQFMHADLPILDPKVAGMIRSPVDLTLLDVGGDDAGATVLAALADAFSGKTFHLLQVVNPYRPYTDTVDGCLLIRRQIEAKAKMAINGIVGNANFMEETTVHDIISGYAFCRKVADAADIPLMFVTVAKTLLTRLDKKAIQCPILPVNRQLTPPWIRAENLDSDEC